MKTWVVLGDYQIPFQDREVVELTLDFVDDLKPDGVVLNGDIVDFYTISNFDKDPLTKDSLNYELEELAWLLDQFDALHEKVFIAGNHEDRLRRYLWKHAPELVGIPALEMPTLLGLAERSWRYLAYGDVFELGKLLITHGNLVRKDSGATARAHFESFGKSVLVNHTHRLGAFYKTRRGEPYVAFENGCLCELKPEYVKNPDWQQGFSVVHVEDNGEFAVQQIPIYRVDGKPKFFYGKEMFS